MDLQSSHPRKRDLLGELLSRLVGRTTLKRLLVAGALFWTPFVLFIALADEVRESDPIPGDIEILQWLNSIATPTLDRVMIFLTDTSGPLQIIVLAAVLFGIMLYKRQRRAATFFLFGLGGSALINLILKALFARDRPDLWSTVVTETSFSFPSGHAMGSSSLAFSLMAILWPTKYRWYAVAGGLAYMVTIGLTRTYLGVHYPSDILAGWSVSLVWVLIVKLVIDHYKDLQRYLSRGTISASER